MKILFDTNVVLDVLLNRAPYASDAIELFTAVENKRIREYLCATTITTVDYLATKVIGKTMAKIAISNLLELFLIAEVNQAILKAALLANFSDFEDAVLHESGCYAVVNGIVTRNSKDFKSAKLPIYSHSELVQIIQSQMSKSM